MTLSKFAFVLNVGFISMMLLDGSMALMTACQDGPQENPVPCILRNPETRDVCYGQGASVNITVKLPQDIMTNLSLAQIKVLVLDKEFSHGSLVAGEHHNKEEDLQRWRIRIIFDGDTMVYEIQNKEVEYRDEFECQLELDIEGQIFRSDFFTWFVVEKCPPPTESFMPGKAVQQLNATCEEDRLENMGEKIDILALEIAQLKTVNSNMQQKLSELAKYTKKANQRTVHSDDQMEKVLEELGNVNKKIGTHNKKQDISSKMDIMIFILLFFSTAKILNVTSLVRSLLNMVSRCPVGSRSNDPMSLSPHLSINDSDYPDDPLVITASNQPNFKEETESLHISPSDENSEETMDEHTNGQALGQEQQGQSLSWESTSTSTHCQCNIDMTSGILVPKETEDLQSE